MLTKKHFTQMAQAIGHAYYNTIKSMVHSFTPNTGWGRESITYSEMEYFGRGLTALEFQYSFLVRMCLNENPNFDIARFQEAIKEYGSAFGGWIDRGMVGIDYTATNSAIARIWETAVYFSESPLCSSMDVNMPLLALILHEECGTEIPSIYVRPASELIESYQHVG